MNKQGEKGLIPKLRFPEFRDKGEWQEKPLNKVCEVNPSSTKLPNSFVYIDLESVEAGELLRKNVIELEGAPSRAQRLLKPGDIIFQMVRPYQKNNYYFQTDDDMEYVASTGYAQLRAKESKVYLYQYLHNDRFVDKVLAKSTGSNYPAINSSDLSSLIVQIPKPEEQQKIAECLSSIDELVTAQNQKLKALKAHKKGLMQQLFPAEGETSPKLRFPKFRDEKEWKKRPFSKLFKIGSGKDHKHLLGGDVPVYGSGGFMRSVNEYLYDGESACIGRKGTINKPMFLTGKFWTVDTLFYTHSFQDCLPKFIFLLFQNINWLKLNEAGGVPSLSKIIINKIEVLIPEINEQRKITDCIFSIDEFISTQSQKLEALKAHKKGLMQQLFPTVDEVEV